MIHQWYSYIQRDIRGPEPTRFVGLQGFHIVSILYEFDIEKMIETLFCFEKLRCRLCML